MRRDINWTTKRDDGSRYDVRVTWFSGQFKFQFKERGEPRWDYDRKPAREDLTVFLDAIERRNPGCLALPEDLKAVSTCIDDDDLDAAGESGAELLRMLAGPDRDRVKNWLASLPTIPRTIFVVRAVAGFTPAETARLLAHHGGSQAAGWTEGAVREFCRQALCSLASQLLQASAAR